MIVYENIFRKRCSPLTSTRAVMEASQSTVGQKIFKFADDVDVNGSRTLGVMTKCDLAITSETDAFEAVCLNHL